MRMIYVMSDIHGNRRRFDSVMEQINLQPDDHLYVIGDVIDRHPYGIGILLQLMGMPNVTMLLGNHEDMMLNALDPDMQPKRYDREMYFQLWMKNKGEPTLNAFMELDKETQETVLRFLHSLPITKTIIAGHKRYLLVHAAPPEMYVEGPFNRYSSKEEYAVWYRIHYDTKLPKGRTVIFGHTDTDEFVREIYNDSYYNEGIWDIPKRKPDYLSIWYGDHRICIDCGSGFPDRFDPDYEMMGRLGCLRLDDGKEFYSKEIFEK